MSWDLIAADVIVSFFLCVCVWFRKSSEESVEEKKTNCTVTLLTDFVLRWDLELF